MTRRIVVVGGGVLGSSAAAALAERGDAVTLITDDPTGTTRVSAASLAWVNAIATSPAYAAVKGDARAVHAQRGVGAGWFFQTGSTADGIVAAEDGYVDITRFIAVHRAQLVAAGGAVRAGIRARGLRRRGSEIVIESEGSDVSGDHIVADAVLIAAGTGTAALARSAGAVAHRLGSAPGARGFLARLRVDHAVTRVESTGGLQLRPDGDGILAVQSLPLERMQAASGERAAVETTWAELRTRTAAALDREIPEDALISIDEAERPMSADGLPVLGWIADRIYVLLAHSGVTLAPLLADLAARDVFGDADARLGPYRP
ncbi:FAD-dependent oxidoreductase [Microbacterium sp. zg.B48]|uniref:FAD-dependent oxidoreductase n=1 Tax=Microbacterium sp. zg.B48 TaxID=2969408 RepID=UPI00214B15E6|nr:FAD-dependent oxidoreductase [Microbacterium sp. zg.B48]MCR2763562.1 FAD-dependent oxidoreductase [Microbacterium sp. zg.B48]